MTHSRLAAAALVAFVTTACVPAMVAGTAARVAAQGLSKNEANDPAGPIRHYIRSNQDGTVRERIVQYRPTPTDISVYKWVEACSTAAYVTAELAPERWEAKTLYAGKLAPDGTQARFGRLDANLITRQLSVSVEMGDQKIRDTAELPAGLPWFLYDYDLADLNAYLQQTRPTDDFTFAFALIWPSRGDDPLQYFATMEAEYLGQMIHSGRAVKRFDLASSDGEPMRGTLWLDPVSGAIIEATFDKPNHEGMRDYRLVLDSVQPGGTEAWKALLADHWTECPD